MSEEVNDNTMLDSLEEKVNTIIERCNALSNENSALQKQIEGLTSERNQEQDTNKKVVDRLEHLISRIESIDTEND
jgi:uncharacterized protein (TIGR02449 family)